MKRPGLQLWPQAVTQRRSISTVCTASSDTSSTSQNSEIRTESLYGNRSVGVFLFAFAWLRCFRFWTFQLAVS